MIWPLNQPLKPGLKQALQQILVGAIALILLVAIAYLLIGGVWLGAFLRGQTEGIYGLFLLVVNHAATVVGWLAIAIIGLAIALLLVTGLNRSMERPVERGAPVTHLRPLVYGAAGAVLLSTMAVSPSLLSQLKAIQTLRIAGSVYHLGSLTHLDQNFFVMQCHCQDVRCRVIYRSEDFGKNDQGKLQEQGNSRTLSRTLRLSLGTQSFEIPIQPVSDCPNGGVSE